MILCLEWVNGSNNGILRATPQILSSRHHGGALVLHSSNIARATRRPRHRHAPLQIPPVKKRKIQRIHLSSRTLSLHPPTLPFLVFQDELLCSRERCLLSLPVSLVCCA